MRQATSLILTIAVLAGLSWFGWRWYQRRPYQPKSSDPRYGYSVAKNYEANSSPARNPKVPAEAMAAYDNAKDAVWDSNFDEAARLLKVAVEIKPDFTEALYNLGATQTHQAIKAIHTDEKTAVQYFRDGVQNKKKSHELMVQGIWFEYNPDEQKQTQADVEQALVEADEIMAKENESALIAALKVWADKQKN